MDFNGETFFGIDDFVGAPFQNRYVGMIHMVYGDKITILWWGLPNNKHPSNQIANRLKIILSSS